MVTKWAIDLDGVVTANPQAMGWLLYHLLKNENHNQVYILTWRDGGDPGVRRNETLADLKRFGIPYNELIMAPRRFTNLRTAAFWKIKMVQQLGINIWFDNDLKSFKNYLGIDLDRLLPDVIKIYI